MLDFLSEVMQMLSTCGGSFRLPARQERTAGFWITRLVGMFLFAVVVGGVWFFYLHAFSQP